MGWDGEVLLVQRGMRRRGGWKMTQKAEECRFCFISASFLLSFCILLHFPAPWPCHLFLTLRRSSSPPPLLLSLSPPPHRVLPPGTEKVKKNAERMQKPRSHLRSAGIDRIRHSRGSRGRPWWTPRTSPDAKTRRECPRPSSSQRTLDAARASKRTPKTASLSQHPIHAVTWIGAAPPFFGGDTGC